MTCHLSTLLIIFLSLLFSISLWILIGFITHYKIKRSTGSKLITQVGCVPTRTWLRHSSIPCSGIRMIPSNNSTMKSFLSPSSWFKLPTTPCPLSHPPQRRKSGSKIRNSLTSQHVRKLPGTNGLPVDVHKRALSTRKRSSLAENLGGG